MFNDRLLLGLKGTTAEAELHVLRLRLNGAIRHKAQRGELRRGLPVGLLWGESEGQVIFHPDQAVLGAIRTVFQKFAELGSARQVWLWFQSEGLSFPHERPSGEILWVQPTYIAIHTVLSNPVYAGAYAYGKSRCERYVDETGQVRKRVRLLPQDQWAVLIPNHHPGFIDWATFEMNQKRLASNCKPGPEQAAGVVREGSALLQGLGTCGRCGRRLRVYYQGKNSTPGYYCAKSPSTPTTRCGTTRPSTAKTRRSSSGCCWGYRDAQWIAKKLYQTEIANLKHFGYGVKGFTLSMIETAIELTEGRIQGTEIQEILNFAKEMLAAPVEVLDGAREAVEALAQRYPLMLITKGDLFDQETKIARSRLGHLFSHIEIWSEKDEETYRALFAKHQLDPARFLMVGNSLKSDVLPVLACGGAAVYIPYQTTWAHEHSLSLECGACQDVA